MYKHAPAFVASLLLYSGVYKLIRPGEATMALVAMDVAPWLAHITIMLVTSFELYIGVLLFFRIDMRYSLGAALAVIFLFSLYLSYLSSLANPPSCGCMALTALFKSNRSNALAGLLRNCILLWLLRGACQQYRSVRISSAAANSSG